MISINTGANKIKIDSKLNYKKSKTLVIATN